MLTTPDEDADDGGRKWSGWGATALGQMVLIAVSMGVLLWALVGARKLPVGLQGLAVVVLPVVVENAFVCGALSVVDERYQNRVMWLVPLVALLLLAELRSQAGAFGRDDRV